MLNEKENNGEPPPLPPQYEFRSDGTVWPLRNVLYLNLPLILSLNFCNSYHLSELLIILVNRLLSVGAFVGTFFKYSLLLVKSNLWWTDYDTEELGTN